MKINPFEIAKMVNNAVKNKDHYKAKIDELKNSPLTGRCGSATAAYDIEKNRISSGEEELEGF
jgi:hypothetical protein